MKLKDVNTWAEYEQYMREQGPEGAAVVDKCIRVAEAVSTAIDALAEIHEPRKETRDFSRERNCA